MSSDTIVGIMIGLGVVVSLGALWILYDAWVDITDSNRVMKWFEETNLGDG